MGGCESAFKTAGSAFDGPGPSNNLSGETVGLKLSAYLNEKGLINTSSLDGTIDFYVSDFPQKFDELGSRFFGEKLSNVEHISIL